MRRLAYSLPLIFCASGAFAQPNLTPHFSVSEGVVGVVNEGGAPAKTATIATVSCTEIGGGSCPDPTPAQAAPYEMPGYPNVAAVKMPPMEAGDGQKHVIAFFDSLVFPAGQYVFTVCVDAGKQIAESDEGDNCERFLKTVAASPARGAGVLKSN